MPTLTPTTSTPSTSTSSSGILAVAIHASSALLPPGDVEGSAKALQRLLWGGVRVAVLVEGGAGGGGETHKRLLSSLRSASSSSSSSPSVPSRALVEVNLCSSQTLQDWKRTLSSAVTALGLPAASVALAMGACKARGDSDSGGNDEGCCCYPSSKTAEKEKQSLRASPAEAAARELGCPIILVVDDNREGKEESRKSSSSTSSTFAIAIERAVAQSHASSPFSLPKTAAAASALLVGVCMRASREEDLLSRGMLPRVPPPRETQRQGGEGGESLGEGGGAAAVVFERVLACELEERCLQDPPLDAILHKVTDELGEGDYRDNKEEEGEGEGEGQQHPFWPRAARSLAALSSSVAARAPASSSSSSSSSSSVVVVDDVASVMLLSDRFETARALHEALGPGNDAASPPSEPPLLLVARPPPALTVSTSEAEVFFSSSTTITTITSATALLSAAGISFPVIVKPRAACGVPEAHRLAVAFDKRGLEAALRAVLGGECSNGEEKKARSCSSLSLNRRRLPAGALIQRYVDHGGVVFKVYAAAAAADAAAASGGGRRGGTAKVFVERRASTPDLSPRGRETRSEDDGGPGWFSFDSAAPLRDAAPWPLSKTPAADAAAADATAEEEEVEREKDQEEKRARAPSLDPRVAQATAEALLSKLGLSLLGFDVVVERGTGECFVVDVNYFPSMKGAESPRGMLAEAVAAQVARVRRKRREEEEEE